MKKPLIIFIIVLVIILILPAAGFIGWFFKEKMPMNVILLDKTVHNLDRVKHRSLHWILANNRIVKKDNKRKYSLRKDYYGFYPNKPLRSKDFRRNDIRLAQVIEHAESNDVLYYADTYGVFFNDWYQGINRSRRSRKLYGGLNNNDYFLMFEMIKANKMVILEYNTFDYPTDAFERYKVEEQFGIQSKGWTGQYYASLDSIDVPPWLITTYKKKYRESWLFKNPGVVLLRGENDVIVLEEGTHLNNALPFIITSSDEADRYSVDPRVAFTGAFDIVDPKEMTVVSKFSLETTDAGAELLGNNFLENEFPAVIANEETRTKAYFCGDFATGNIAPWSACFGSLNMFSRFLYDSDDNNDPRRFFWLYYKPLLTNMLEDYYESLEK